MTIDELKKGEHEAVEYKLDIPAEKEKYLKTAVAFANAAGGYVLIGVDNDNHIVGAEIDNNKRSAIQGTIGEISPALKCELYSVDVGDKKV